MGSVASLALTGLSLLLVYCTQHASTPAEQTSTGGAGTSGQASGFCGGACGGTTTTFTFGGRRPGVPLDDAGLDAGPAPTVACAGDAGQEGGQPPGAPDACPLPDSYCADPGWLVFYASATCTDGFCQYERRAMQCICENGGCSITL
jgi:hypothetical protein